MWNYEKRLQYPVNIKTPNAKVANYIMSQYGGPDGEINASLRYLSQRFTAANKVSRGVLNDIGTEASEMVTVKGFCHILWQNTPRNSGVLSEMSLCRIYS